MLVFSGSVFARFGWHCWEHSVLCLKCLVPLNIMCTCDVSVRVCRHLLSAKLNAISSKCVAFVVVVVVVVVATRNCY